MTPFREAATRMANSIEVPGLPFEQVPSKELIDHFERELVRAYNQGVEKAAKAFDGDIEKSSSEAHDAYQEEAHRRGDVRHPDLYEELKESTKEWDQNAKLYSEDGFDSFAARDCALGIRNLKSKPESSSEKGG